MHVRHARDTHEEWNSRSINLPHDVNEPFFFFSSFISFGQTLWVLLAVLCVHGAIVAGLMIVQYFIYDCLRGSREMNKKNLNGYRPSDSNEKCTWFEERSIEVRLFVIR